MAALGKSMQRIQDRVRQLAGAGREDPAAVAELRRLTGHRRDGKVQAVLGQVAGRLAAGGIEAELRQHDRAIRLLRAAAWNVAVEPEDPAETARFDAVEELLSLPDEAAFDELAQREPELLRVRADLESELSQAAATAPSKPARHGPQYAQLHERLAPLLGPDRHPEDVLLSCRVALSVALRYLIRLAAPSPGPPIRAD